ncbi:MAG: sigma-70 family RNA polymerase sigma factor [Cyclobacteriaceae bacterium]
MSLLGKLYYQYMHLVYGLCLKYLKSREDSQDAVMNIFEKISISLKDQEVTHFKSWLYTVTKHHCLMILRKDKKMLVNTEKIMESDIEMHQHNEELEENISALEKCIQQLKDIQQSCVRLFFLEKKSYQDIADLKEIELKTIKSHIQNGKRNLKICMEKQ